MTDNIQTEAAAEASGDDTDLLRRCHAAALRLGIQQLYPEQERTVAASLAARDVLVVLPTGFGKSACYQVPSMVLPQPVVLVSPLLALLRDQHEKLLARHIPVERIDGTIRGVARREALKRVAAGGSVLVMTTPETLAGDELGGALHASGIALVAVDEAHCISEWGHDFRPAYLRLGERLRELGAPPVLALTATATQSVRDDIVRYLGMRNPEVVAGSPHRANLAFEVMQISGADRLRALARFVKRLHRPGIVYCATTKAVDDLYGALRLLRMPVHHYHGRMAAKERNAEQELYMRAGRRTIMVATSAFGLGIDKPDIRYIVHYQSPASLEQYVQEAGRAGRDGRRANCILLFDPKDRDIHEALLQTSRVRPDQLYRLAAALAAWAGEERVPAVDALALAAQLSERQAQALLAVLEEAGFVTLGEDGIRITVPAADFQEQARSLAGRFLTLRTQDGRRLDRLSEYANTTECRAIYLRTYFGEEAGAPCGLCDICRGAPQRPSTFWQPIARPPRGKPQRGKRHRKRRRGGPPSGVAQGGAPHGDQTQPRPPQPGASSVGEPQGYEPHAGDAAGSGPPRRKRRRRRRRGRGGGATAGAAGPNTQAPGHAGGERQERNELPPDEHHE
ncbi:MAG TPA: RecQ family ATP-dependent DNA helicase [Candidatus Acidoferrales bacterium]|nr:RecQ family ATP-dependent DNA helicase [Candidatus Acidoferrales bacterium]